MEVHASVRERLDGLAPDQRAAATAPRGPVLCIAPAGSGKTTTLIARICWLIGQGADPARITALTFNRRAADDLRERLTTALAPLGGSGIQPRVRTFHALGREILAEAGVSVANLVDRADVVRLLHRGRPVSAPWLRRIDDAFSRLKLDLRLDAGRVKQLLDTASNGSPLPADLALLRAYVAYEGHLSETGQLDFDDLVGRALDHLEGDSGALAAWRSRCSTLLVDEVQDVDRSQLDLAILLAGERRDIFLVGDDDQTIYAWRLADARRSVYSRTA